MIWAELRNDLSCLIKRDLTRKSEGQAFFRNSFTSACLFIKFCFKQILKQIFHQNVTFPHYLICYKPVLLLFSVWPKRSASTEYTCSSFSVQRMDTVIQELSSWKEQHKSSVTIVHMTHVLYSKTDIRKIYQTTAFFSFTFKSCNCG